MQTENSISDLEPFCMALDVMGKKDLAVEVLDAFAENSFNFQQLDNLSKCYFKLKEYEKAIKFGENALAQILDKSNELLYVTRFNLINIYNHANYPEKAMAYIRCNEVFNPSDFDLALEKAYSLYLLNRKNEAEKILLDLLENESNLKEEYVTKIKFNLGTYYLYRDEFQKGMQHFIFYGAKMKLWNNHTIFSRNQKLNLPFWQGSAGVKNLIVFAEAGIGDEIINIRFMDLLKEKGINAVWYEATYRENDNDRPGLIEVFRESGYHVISNLREIENLDSYAWTYSMHLPIYLNLQYEDLWRKPYLKTPAKHSEKWKKLIREKSSKPLKIGIRWQGSPLYDQDLHRSYPLRLLYENLKGIDAEFFSLQKHNGLEEMKDFPELIDLNDNLETLEDVFGAVENLDLIITSCTSIAHAAGSLGKNTFVLIPISAYYTWSHSMKQSPWYGDHLKLFRQVKPRSWVEPIEELRQELSKLIEFH